MATIQKKTEKILITYSYQHNGIEKTDYQYLNITFQKAYFHKGIEPVLKRVIHSKEKTKDRENIKIIHLFRSCR